MRLVIRLVIIALVIGGGAISRDRLTSAANKLELGDCFDTKHETAIEDLQRHPCTESHTAEVVLAADYPAANTAPYPGKARMSLYNDQTCTAAVISYMGLRANFDALNYGMYFPQEAGWIKGDRRITCYVFMLNGGQMTASLKAH